MQFDQELQEGALSRPRVQFREFQPVTVHLGSCEYRRLIFKFKLEIKILQNIIAYIFFFRENYYFAKNSVLK